MSGGMRVRPPSPVRLSMISNAVAPRGATVVTARLSMRAIGGACCAMASTAASTDPAAPSNSQCTEPESLNTNPVTPWRAAVRATAGRNPTPWTTPVMSRRTRTVADASRELLMDLLSSSEFRVDWAVRRGPLTPG